jgi:hypothetical protein
MHTHRYTYTYTYTTTIIIIIIQHAPHLDGFVLPGALLLVKLLQLTPDLAPLSTLPPLKLHKLRVERLDLPGGKERIAWWCVTSG